MPHHCHNKSDKMKHFCIKSIIGSSICLLTLCFSSNSFGQAKKSLLDSISYSQYEPYNDSCPKTGGKLSPTGCVSTALGQIARYYTYPDNGKGTVNYTTLTGALDLELVLSEPYKWSSIRKEYQRANASKDQKIAIAKLLRDIGYAVHTDYGSDGSGASGIDGGRAMINNFGYSKGLRYLEKIYYSSLEWENIIRAEIDSARPVYYEGKGKKGSHSFLIDGYRQDGLFHINWGWGGKSDGYFRLSDPDGFTENNAMLVGLCPPGKEDPEAFTLYRLSGWDILEGDIELSRAWNCTVSVLNESFTTFNGIVGIGLFRADKLIRVLGQTQVSYSSFTWEEGRKINVSVPTDLENGVYRCAWVFKPDNGLDYAEIHGQILHSDIKNSNNNYILLEKSDTKYRLSKGLLPKVSCKIITSGASAQKAKVKLSDGDNVYADFANAEGICVFDSVPIGLYRLEVEMDYHPRYAKNIYVWENEIKTDTLYENVQNPIIVKADTSASDVFLKWVQPQASASNSWSDDIESYSDFAIDSIGVWRMSAAYLRTNLLGKTDFLHEKDPQAYIVFNPEATSPSVAGYGEAYSGKKSLVAFAKADGSVCNDTLMHRVGKGGGLFSFWAKGIGNVGSPEKCEVICFSEKSGKGELVAKIDEVSKTWQQYLFVLSESTTAVAMVYTSDDGQALWLDDFEYKLNEKDSIKHNKPIGFALYGDGKKIAVANANDSVYKFTFSTRGYHSVGVQALFRGGSSEVITDTVFLAMLEPVTPPEDTLVVCNVIAPDSLSVLLEPSKDYRLCIFYTRKIGSPVDSVYGDVFSIYLDGKKMEDFWADTAYILGKLSNGQHTVGVEAVLDTCRSEKTEFNFKVESVAIEGSVDGSLEGSKLRIFPNPFTGGAFVVESELAGQINVYDSRGKCCFTTVISSGGRSLVDLGKSTSGLFVVELRSALGVIRTKVIAQ